MDTATCTARDALVARIREHPRSAMPPDTDQLLRDAAAFLIQLGPGPVAVPPPSASPLGLQTGQALVAAAMAHFKTCGCDAFIAPVPGTTPRRLIALGEREQLAEILSAQATAQAQVQG